MLGPLDGVSSRFGQRVAGAIAEAYEVAVLAGSGTILTTDQRLQIVEALLREAEGGWVDALHLKAVALSVLPLAAVAKG